MVKTKSGGKRSYELTVIVDPSVGQEEKQRVLEKIRKLVKKDKGKIEKEKDWGVRELAYPINKNKEALYFYFELQAEGRLEKMLQEEMEMEERLLRYLLIRQ